MFGSHDACQCRLNATCASFQPNVGQMSLLCGEELGKVLLPLVSECSASTLSIIDEACTSLVLYVAVASCGYLIRHFLSLTGSEKMELFPLADLPHSTRCAIFQGLQETLRDRTALSYLQCVVRDAKTWQHQEANTVSHIKLFKQCIKSKPLLFLTSSVLSISSSCLCLSLSRSVSWRRGVAVKHLI